MPFDAEITQKSRDLIVLEKARERIARGWCQGELWTDDAFCILGAFWFGRSETPADYEAEGRYLDALALPLVIQNGARPAAAWNDASGRTQAEVLARFDAAIEKLAGRS